MRDSLHGLSINSLDSSKLSLVLKTLGLAEYAGNTVECSPGT